MNLLETVNLKKYFGDRRFKPTVAGGTDRC